jgi:hypothetical protein
MKELHLAITAKVQVVLVRMKEYYKEDGEVKQMPGQISSPDSVATRRRIIRAASLQGAFPGTEDCFFSYSARPQATTRGPSLILAHGCRTIGSGGGSPAARASHYPPRALPGTRATHTAVGVPNLVAGRTRGGRRPRRRFTPPAGPHLTSAAKLDVTPVPREHLLQVPVFSSAPRRPGGGGEGEGGFLNPSPFCSTAKSRRQEFGKRFGGLRGWIQRPRTISGRLPARESDGIASAGAQAWGRAPHPQGRFFLWQGQHTGHGRQRYWRGQHPASVDQPFRPAHWAGTAETLEVPSQTGAHISDGFDKAGDSGAGHHRGSSYPNTTHLTPSAGKGRARIRSPRPYLLRLADR